MYLCMALKNGNCDFPLLKNENKLVEQARVQLTLELASSQETLRRALKTIGTAEAKITEGGGGLRLTDVVTNSADKEAIRAQRSSVMVDVSQEQRHKRDDRIVELQNENAMLQRQIGGLQQASENLAEDLIVRASTQVGQWELLQDPSVS